VKIEQVEVFQVYYPWAGYFKFLEGSPGHAAIFVKITADNGVVGWGQSLPVPKWSYETPETAMIVLRDYLAPALVGRDPRDIAGAHAVLDRALAPSFTTATPITRAGLDIALHDLAGKLEGKSVSRLWGRERGGPVRLSWTINVRTLEEADGEIEAAQKRGYRDFNIKISPDPTFDVGLVRRIRRQAPDSFLWVDANGGYDLDTALEIAPKLADAGVGVFEAPLRPNQISGYQTLKKQGALPITMDEGVVSPVEAQEFIRLNMVDGLTIKVSRCGGLLSARRQIELVQDAGMFWMGSGLTDPDISLAASLILYGSYGLRKAAALNGPQFLQAHVLTTPLSIRKDVAEVPVGSGLGIEVDEAKLRDLVERTQRLRAS
jgi:L-alanine-DL-glutamate epimerase-like enolase superfamily enzyme